MSDHDTAIAYLEGMIHRNEREAHGMRESIAAKEREISTTRGRIAELEKDTKSCRVTIDALRGTS